MAVEGGGVLARKSWQKQMDGLQIRHSWNGQGEDTVLNDAFNV